ncbi:MAG TPA: helix-turn-helix transcriptional regulator [Tissierellaceae bacterium]|nr:helix-turn-helix transcriptional regulator [Tissierellaceae bacterium]
MVIKIDFSKRQEEIIRIVKNNQPITGKNIASKLNLARSTLRPDLSLLTMIGILDARPRVGYFHTGKFRFSSASDEVKKIVVDDVKAMPIVLEESTSIYDAIVFMFLENVDSLYITDKGILSGVISRKDIIRTAMGGTDLYTVPVGIIMTRMPNIISIKSEDSLLNAANKLIEHEVNSLPVVEEIEDSKNQYKVVGRITKTTITRLFVEIGNND